MKAVRLLLVSLAVLLGAATVAGCAETEEAGSGAESATDEPKTKKKKANSCGSKATDDCTPRVKMGQKVKVDTLNWRVAGVKTATALGDQQYGLGAKADGTFVIVKLKVTSDRNESATLTDEIAQLVIDGNTYKADSDGTVAAIGAGEEPMWFEDISPGSTMRTQVVFDVPPAALSKKMQMRFGEIGFGSTEAFIQLPSL